MAFKLADRVQQQSRTSGTGSLTLELAVPLAYQSVRDGIGNGNTSYFCAFADDPAVVSGQWEVFKGTVTDGTQTVVSRDQVLASSVGGAVKVDFAPECTKTIFCTIPASRVMLKAADLTAGSIPFADADGHLAQDNAALFWDGTNDRLGLGTTAPGTPAHLLLNNATTAAIDYLFTHGHNSTGTPAAGFGSGEKWQLKSDTTADTDVFTFAVSWVTATHASRAARAVYSVYDTAARECLRMEADGTTGRVGIAGAVSASAALNVNGSAAITDLTAGSVPFVGTAGLVTQDNASLFWDNTNKYLGAGIGAPLAPVHARRSTAVTGAARDVLVVDHTSSGTPTTGFGGNTILILKSSTTEARTAAKIIHSWIVATDASRTGRVRFLATDYNGDREGFRVDSDGTQALISFFGVAAVARAPAYTPTNVTTDRSFDADATSIDELADILGTLIADLQAYGLLQ